MGTVSHRYVIEDDSLQDLLDAHPGAGVLLHQIADRAPRYFPELTGLVIRSVHDPEDGTSGWYVVVETPAPVDLVMEQLDRFDHDWWPAAKANVSPEFVTTVELV